MEMEEFPCLVELVYRQNVPCDIVDCGDGMRVVMVCLLSNHISELASEEE